MKKIVALITVVFICLPLISGCAAFSGKANPASDFEYETDTEKKEVLINKYVGTDTGVVIPSHIEGMPVVGLRGVPSEQLPGIMPPSEGVFEDSNIKSVVIPKTVRYIGVGAFSGCLELTNVKMLSGSELEVVGVSSFEGCEKLEKIDFSKTQLKRIGEFAFKGCTALEEVKFSDVLETIDSMAFYKCSSLVEADLPDSLTKIEGEAFAYCSSLQRIVIPARLEWDDSDFCPFSMAASSVEIELAQGREEIKGYALFGANDQAESVRIIIPESVKRFSPLPFHINPSVKVELVFEGNAPEIVEEKDPDWFGDVTVRYDTKKDGWETFEWKDKFDMRPKGK